MVFVESVRPTAVAAVAGIASFITPKELNVNEGTSVRGVARSIAQDVMAYYPGTPEVSADIAPPYYWWEFGAMTGSMLDYSHYTKDTTYDKTLATILLAQTGEKHDYMLEKHYGDEGNDDQAFWGFAVMAAAERNFPQPNPAVPSWLQMVENIHATMTSRWHTDTCGGGLAWQIFESNPNGMHYKNSVSNGGFFQLSARLARATGNQTYLDWAERIWDWTAGVGLIDENFNIYDGVDSKDNCTSVNHLSFSYSTGIFMYGAAVLANTTGDKIWTDRTKGILTASKSFFSPFENATNIMYEHACEHVGSCNTDMLSFKGYFSRFAFASTLMVDSIKPTVDELLKTSAAAAAKACTGGEKGTTCGQKWYVGGYDGHTGLGQEMCALETIQGILVSESAPPFKGDEIEVVREFAAVPGTAPAAVPAAPVSPAAPSVRSAQPVAVPEPSASVAGVPVPSASAAAANRRLASAGSVSSSNLLLVGLAGVAGAMFWSLF